jgi:hypothetical protein
MGWDAYYAWQTLGDVHRHIEGNYSEGYKVLAVRKTSYGRHHWMVVETPEGERFIAFTLIRGKSGDYAKKDMSESCGPSYYDCPLSLFDLVPEPPNEWAKAWRENVRAHHEAKRRKFQPGDRVLSYGKLYTVHGKLGKGKRSYTIIDDDGRRWRSTPERMTLVEPEPKAEPEPEIVFSTEKAASRNG